MRRNVAAYVSIRQYACQNAGVVSAELVVERFIRDDKNVLTQNPTAVVRRIFWWDIPSCGPSSDSSYDKDYIKI